MFVSCLPSAPDLNKATIILWKYFANVDTDRQELLLSAPPFEVQATALILVAELEQFCWEPFSGSRLKGCGRADFLLRIPEHHYDSFFNSPNGHRGQYAISPVVGEDANRLLVEQLMGNIITQARQKFGIDEELAVHSVSGEGAKVWIYESEVESHYYDDTPEIDFKRWQKNSGTGAGLRAPQGTRLELKGAWFDTNNTVRVDPYKENRSEEIYMTGFS